MSKNKVQSSAAKKWLVSSEIVNESCWWNFGRDVLNPLNPELNLTCYLLALLGAHHFLHVSRIRVKLLTLSY